uniref:Uncharacterized protein n=1 Tax=Neogobius melanostomus TaxID=47308 RepID=A0A8C6SY09_9GOBI
MCISVGDRYESDVLSKDSGECSICLEELLQGRPSRDWPASASTTRGAGPSRPHTPTHTRTVPRHALHLHIN